MSRFPDPKAFFEGVYREPAPWDIGRPQPALMAMLDEFPPPGPVLDLGCGTGDLAIAVADRGLAVLGVDLVAEPIRLAAERAASRLDGAATGSLEFVVGDALRPSTLGGPFGAILDSGFYHILEADQRDALTRELAGSLKPGGRFYLLGFAVEFPLPNTPLEITEEELSARFSPDRGWNILKVTSATFETRMGPIPAIAACFQKADTRPG